MVKKVPRLFHYRTSVDMQVTAVIPAKLDIGSLVASRIPDPTFAGMGYAKYLFTPDQQATNLFCQYKGARESQDDCHRMGAEP
jgi:hypothetical protein